MSALRCRLACSSITTAHSKASGPSSSEIASRTTETAAALALVGGCSTIGRQIFKQPAVGLQDVRLTGLGLAGGNLDIVLRVYNPNGDGLDATRTH